MLYARTSTVSVERSKAEIRRLMGLYGGRLIKGRFEPGTVGVVFEHVGVIVRVAVAKPEPLEARFRFTDKRLQPRTAAQIRRRVEQDLRRCWRVIVLMVRANLEAWENSMDGTSERFVVDDYNVARKVMRLPELAEDHAEALGLERMQPTGSGAQPRSTLRPQTIKPETVTVRRASGADSVVGGAGAPKSPIRRSEAETVEPLPPKSKRH